MRAVYRFTTAMFSARPLAAVTAAQITPDNSEYP